MVLGSQGAHYVRRPPCCPTEQDGGTSVFVYPPLQFQPFASEATAHGLVALDSEEGDLTVVVQRFNEPVGACIAGYVGERRTLSGGTVVDTADGEHGRRARAYTSDGSLIDVSVTGALMYGSK